MSISMHVCLVKEGDQWSACGLEYDIAGQGKTKREAVASLRHIVEGHMYLDKMDGRKMFYGIPKAPDWYWHIKGSEIVLVRF